MTHKRPKGITFIGYFYIFGAIMLMLSLAFDTKQAIPFGLRFGVPHISDNTIIPLISFLSLAISYGYLRLKKWGYWLMMLYSLLFLFISLDLLTKYGTQPFIGNTLWSLFVIIYTYRKKTYLLS